MRSEGKNANRRFYLDNSTLSSRTVMPPVTHRFGFSLGYSRLIWPCQCSFPFEVEWARTLWVGCIPTAWDYSGRRRQQESFMWTASLALYGSFIDLCFVGYCSLTGSQVVRVSDFLILGDVCVDVTRSFVWIGLWDVEWMWVPNRTVYWNAWIHLGAWELMKGTAGEGLLME